MKALRIRKDRFYVLSEVPGISGFQQWDRTEETVVTAQKAKSHRIRVIREIDPETEKGHFYAHDGHLPGYRPILEGREAFEWLRNNPYQALSLV